jgi:hypothetical protein
MHGTKACPELVAHVGGPVAAAAAVFPVKVELLRLQEGYGEEMRLVVHEVLRGHSLRRRKTFR